MRRGSCVWGECERRWRMDYRFASVPCDEANIKISGRLPCHAGGFGAVDTTQGAPHNPARTWHPRDATFESGGVTRAAKGADCKSAGLRLRRFESYLPHHSEDSERTTQGRIRQRTPSCIVRSLSSGCGCSSMVEQQPSKLMTRVRFPSPAPTLSRFSVNGFAVGFAGYVPFSALLSCWISALVAA